MSKYILSTIFLLLLFSSKGNTQITISETSSFEKIIQVTCDTIVDYFYFEVGYGRGKKYFPSDRRGFNSTVFFKGLSGGGLFDTDTVFSLVSQNDKDFSDILDSLKIGFQKIASLNIFMDSLSRATDTRNLRKFKSLSPKGYTLFGRVKLKMIINNSYLMIGNIGYKYHIIKDNVLATATSSFRAFKPILQLSVADY